MRAGLAGPQVGALNPLWALIRLGPLRRQGLLTWRPPGRGRDEERLSPLRPWWRESSAGGALRALEGRPAGTALLHTLSCGVFWQGREETGVILWISCRNSLAHESLRGLSCRPSGSTQKACPSARNSSQGPEKTQK